MQVLEGYLDDGHRPKRVLMVVPVLMTVLVSKLHLLVLTIENVFLGMGVSEAPRPEGGSLF